MAPAASPAAAATVTKTPAQGKKGDSSTDAEQDFFWTYTEEPHRTRRLAIIKAHPEVFCGLSPAPYC